MKVTLDQLLYLQNSEKISSEPGQNGEYFDSLEEAIE